MNQKVPNREYYRKLRQRARNFRVDLPKKEWCDLWHTHFDWEGFGNRGWYHRHKHMVALFEAFRRAQDELASQPVPYQVFLNISKNDAGADAIFVHTPNANRTPFPHDFSECKVLTHVPPLLVSHVDLARYQIGQQSDGTEVWYTVIPIRA